MAEAGFDYIPVIPPDEAYISLDAIDQEQLVRTEGFGITTRYGRDVEVVELGWEDPNQERVDSMSEAQRQAWLMALHGRQESPGSGTIAPGSEATLELGCVDRAADEVYATEIRIERVLTGLSPELDAMRSRIDADPRILDAQAQWTRCMAEAGYAFASMTEMIVEVYEIFEARLAEIVGPDPLSDLTEAELDALLSGMSPQEAESFLESARNRDYDEMALAALQRDEIDLAIADFECRRGYDDIYREVSAEYEALFIDQHRELLETLLPEGDS